MSLPKSAVAVGRPNEGPRPRGPRTAREEEAGRDEDGGDQSDHASPAMRRMPSPFWPAPSSPVRDSAQPVP